MPPFVRPEKPLEECRLALVTTSGVHLPEQPRFDIDDPLGDCSYREIPADTAQLTWTHAYYRPDEGADLDAVFPLWTIRELAAVPLVRRAGRERDRGAGDTYGYARDGGGGRSAAGGAGCLPVQLPDGRAGGPGAPPGGRAGRARATPRARRTRRGGVAFLLARVNSAASASGRRAII